MSSAGLESRSVLKGVFNSTDGRFSRCLEMRLSLFRGAERVIRDALCGARASNRKARLPMTDCGRLANCRSCI